MKRNDDLHEATPGFAFKFPDAPAPVMTDSGSLVPEDLGSTIASVPAGDEDIGYPSDAAFVGPGDLVSASGLMGTKTLTVDSSSGGLTWTADASPWGPLKPIESVGPYVSGTLSGTTTGGSPGDASGSDAAPYASGFLPHLVRAKEEGVRKGIEMDTVVIDRGIAVSIGLDPGKSHVDMVLGLRVRYAKEHSLPMDSAFVILKERKGEKPPAAAKPGKTPDGIGCGSDVGVSPEEGERTSPVLGITGTEILGSRRGSTPSCGKRFVSFPYDEDGKPILLSVDKIVCVEDRYVDGDPSLGWLGLEVTFEVGNKERVIVIRDKKVAERIWDDLRTTMIYHS